MAKLWHVDLRNKSRLFFFQLVRVRGSNAHFVQRFRSLVWYPIEIIQSHRISHYLGKVRHVKRTSVSFSFQLPFRKFKEGGFSLPQQQKLQATVVGRLDNIIHRINRHQNKPRYMLDSVSQLSDNQGQNVNLYWDAKRSEEIRMYHRKTFK